jgi:hypothetical protein
MTPEAYRHDHNEPAADHPRQRDQPPRLSPPGRPRRRVRIGPTTEPNEEVSAGRLVLHRHPDRHASDAARVS